MSNMSYCRFENTERDLRDCEKNLYAELEAGGYEDRARASLVRMCHAIAEQVSLDEIEDLPVEEDEDDNEPN